MIFWKYSGIRRARRNINSEAIVSRLPNLLRGERSTVRAESAIMFYSYYRAIAPLPEVESRTQGSRPRRRTQKKSEAKAKDSLSEDRHSRGQGQECSRPRPRTKDTSASALQKKKGLQKIFQAISRTPPLTITLAHFMLLLAWGNFSC